MSVSQVRGEAAAGSPKTQRVDMKLEAIVIPVSDVDRAKRFYGGLGWRLDADFVVGDAFRGIQFTPPGSACSIQFGIGITSAAAFQLQRGRFRPERPAMPRRSAPLSIRGETEFRQSRRARARSAER